MALEIRGQYLLLLLITLLSLRGVRTHDSRVMKISPDEGEKIYTINLRCPSFGTVQCAPCEECAPCKENLPWYIIRNPHSGLVMGIDKSNEAVLQHFDGHPQQLWKFIPLNRSTPSGEYNVVNNLTGTVLDCCSDKHPNHIIVKKKYDTRFSQRWSLHFGDTLYNIGKKKVLDIILYNYSPGTHFHLWDSHGGENQKFALEAFDP